MRQRSSASAITRQPCQTIAAPAAAEAQRGGFARLRKVRREAVPRKKRRGGSAVVRKMLREKERSAAAPLRSGGRRLLARSACDGAADIAAPRFRRPPPPFAVASKSPSQRRLPQLLSPTGCHSSCHANECARDAVIFSNSWLIFEFSPKGIRESFRSIFIFRSRAFFSTQLRISLLPGRLSSWPPGMMARDYRLYRVSYATIFSLGFHFRIASSVYRWLTAF